MATNDLKPIYTLTWTNTFTRTDRKFLRFHPDLISIFKDVLETLKTDPQSPRLHLHSLHGKYQGKHSVKLTFDYRIVLILKIIEK